MDGRAWSPGSFRVKPPGNVPFGAPTSSLEGGRKGGGRREEGGEEGGRRGEGRREGGEGRGGEQGEMYIIIYICDKLYNFII